MDLERRQRYLEKLLADRGGGAVRHLVPVVNRWHDLLGSVPGLARRNPGAHCRVSGLSAGVLTVEADHPAWLQLLQWHQGEVVERLGGWFPQLQIRALNFRLSRPGDPVERPTVVMPPPADTTLSAEEQAQLDGLIGELEALIRQGPKA